VSTEPTLGEVVRTLERIEIDISRRFAELGARLDRVVGTDVYEAHRAATDERIKTVAADIEDLREDLERERTERRADRRVVVGAVLAAALALIVAGLSAALGLK